MEPNETVLADIHIDMSLTCPFDHTENLDINVKYAGYVTRFLFSLCSSEDCDHEDDNNCDKYAVQPPERYCHRESLSTNDDDASCPYQLCSSVCEQSSNDNDSQGSRNKYSAEHVYDDDGDLVVKRKCHQQFEVIYIEHTIATRLCDVGLQVWSGCLYLCDFIIHEQQMFDKAVVLELGAGVGLASIVASMFADRIFSTDVGDDVLETCRHNVDANKHLRHLPSDSVLVRRLDWLQSDLQTDGTPFSWTEEDVNNLYLANVLMSSDVVYSDELTDAYFQTVGHILTKKQTAKTVVMSLERRLNFTLADLEVSCSAYTYFRQCIERLGQIMVETNRSFKAQMIDSIPQYFRYERSKYLELWLLSVGESETSSSQ